MANKDLVFISYSHRDEEFVLRLSTDLENRGAQVWLDRGDIQGGEQWRRSIERGVQACAAFLLVISPDAIGSKYVAEEIGYALRYRKAIFPLVYRRTNIPEAISRQLEGFQFLDFTQGGYATNLTDLLLGLQRLGVPLHAAQELSPSELAERRRQRLGAPVRAQWGAAFLRIPGWALAWAIGWALLFTVLLVINAYFNEPSNTIIAWPVGGFAGGLLGGLVAGIFTMFALRHNAVSIGWKHMSSAIRIWGLIGPIACAGVIAATLAFYEPNIASQAPDCSTLGLGECFAAGFAYAIGAGIAYGLALAFVMILLVLLAVFLLGALAGWLAVRRIRRLEPGILGRQSFWVISGWGIGATVAVIAAVTVMAFLEQAI